MSLRGFSLTAVVNQPKVIGPAAMPFRAQSVQAMLA